MTQDHWSRVKEAFLSLLDNPHDRPRLLSAMPEQIRSDAVRMLHDHEAAESGQFLSRPFIESTQLLQWLGGGQVFQPGQILLERFEIVRLLGAGGMGEVYEVVNLREPGRLALKTVRQELLKEARIVERFRKEGDRARKVSHPNVCQVYEVFQAPGPAGSASVPFYTMELLLGETLDERIARTGPSSDAASLDVAVQVCRGLYAAHQAGILHLDLKAANVILTNEDGREHARLTDFGLARELPANGGATTGTVTGSLTGTLAYIAPELLEGQRSASTSDIYSLGVLLFRMVTGRYPFEAEAELVSAAMRLRRAAPSPSIHAVGLPRAWEAAIAACLSREPAFRPRTALQVAELLQGSTTASLTLTRQRVIHTLTRRSSMAAAAAVTAGIAGTAAYRYWTAPPFRDRPLRVLVEDFRSADPGGALGRALRNIVRARLRGIGNVQVLGAADVAKAMVELNMATQPVRDAAALSLARHARADVTLGGMLDERAQGLTIRIRALAANSGKPYLEASAIPGNHRSLVAATERLCGEVYARLTGGSPSDVQSNAQTEEADTARPDAFEQFTSGLEYFHDGDINTAVDYLREAVKLDPEFGMAYAFQATALGALRRDDLAFPAVVKGYLLRDRLNERQRLQTDAAYHYARGDIDQALDLQKKLAARYPTEAPLHRAVAQTLASLNQLDEAIQHGRTAVELDPDSPVNYMVLASAQAQGERFKDAFDTLAQGRKKAPASPLLDSSEGVVRMIEGDSAGSLAALKRLENTSQYTSHGRIHSIRCFLLYGRLAEARQWLEADVLHAGGENSAAQEELTRYWLGSLCNLDGQHEAAASHAAALAARVAEPYNLQALRAAASLAFEAGSAPVLDQVAARMKTIEANYPSHAVTASRRYTQGLQASLRGQRGRATEALAQAHSLRPDIVHTWALARNHQQNVTFSLALPLYESVVDRKGVAIRWDQPLLWIRSLLEDARCCKAMGHTGDAKRCYDRFLAQWGGQAANPVVLEALRERKSLV
jgi:tetratricopeptide (TPR) repeat protein